MTVYVDPLRLLAEAMASVLAPAKRISPLEWASANLTVPDGTRAGERWDPELTPYIAEPLNFVGPDSPVNEIAVMKGAQSGFTTLLIAAIGHSIDLDPCRMMVIQPTDSALSDFNREKLQPAVDSSPVLKDKVEPQSSRSGEGSTTYSKKFPGGSLSLAIGSSAADLRSKTIKKMFRDEIDQWPDDLDGQGNPLKLSDARQFAFLAQGDWKRVDISTPTVKGASKIERRYEAGDRRRWFVPCPHCDTDFVFEYGAQFKHERHFPFKACYVAPCCGAIISAYERDGLVRKGVWKATAARPGAFPSYHFDNLSSPFIPWDQVASEAVEAGEDPEKLKAFYNLTLGLPFEVRGDAPAHKTLMARCEDYGERGHVPEKGLILTGAADVQMRGIWWEVKAWAPNRESWVVDTGYFDGSTEDPEGPAFDQLAMLLDREFPDAFGGVRKLDALGVDSGYRSHVVYAWTKANDRPHPDSGQSVVLALKGKDGWGQPAIGTPTLVDIDLAGRKVKKGCRLWPVGTWPLKAAFNANLAKEGIASKKEVDPSGYCHFAKWLDDTYFKQITSEYLTDTKVNGKIKRVWKLSASERDNHLLDCSIYNMALAEYLGLSSWTKREIAALSRARGLIASLSVIPASPPPEDDPPPSYAPTIRPAMSQKRIVDDDDLDEIAKRNSEFWQ